MKDHYGRRCGCKVPNPRSGRRCRLKSGHWGCHKWWAYKRRPESWPDSRSRLAVLHACGVKLRGGILGSPMWDTEVVPPVVPPKEAVAKSPEAVWPRLNAYARGYNIPQGVGWQQYVMDYSISHGPALDSKTREEFERWKAEEDRRWLPGVPRERS
jgi:hypothetical protein